MKKFFMFLSYGVLIAIIIFLFDSILSGRWCYCHPTYKINDDPYQTFLT